MIHVGAKHILLYYTKNRTYYSSTFQPTFRTSHKIIQEIACDICGEVQRNEAIIANERTRHGRFILASNDKTLDGELMLQYYKGQNAVEKGFRFLKDKASEWQKSISRKRNGSKLYPR